MSKRFREDIEVATTEDSARPVGFAWRGRTYSIGAVLGHWREDAGYWIGGGVEIPQRDLWRVEAAGAVFELVHDVEGWRLDRIWD